MSWASTHIEKLRKGETVSFRPTGQSMTPRIESGNLVIVSPDVADLRKGDIVLCKCKGRHFCHLISAIQGERFQISNNHGHINGWVGRSCIFGKVVQP